MLSGLEKLLSNAPCSKASPAWWSEDNDALHGTQIDSLTTMHGFKQIIFNPFVYYPSHCPVLT